MQKSVNLETQISVSGNIISELSEKIPSNLIAINELIKNSYDAGAKNVLIKLDSQSKTLTIQDDGEGMDKEDISSLFHISKSKKIYAQINKKFNRYVQGSKGLGFLSVFKFGKKVKWQTKKDIGYEFEVDFDTLVSQDDISSFNIHLDENNSLPIGTTICITLSEKEFNFLISNLSQENSYKRILNSFSDESINISLEIDSEKYDSNYINDFHSIMPDKQIYNVKYDSKAKKINYYYKSKFLFSHNFAFISNSYELMLDLIIFNFTSGDTKKVDELYINPFDEVTPLLYVNDNLFCNYVLFRPSTTRYSQNKKSLPQIIGKIKLYSSDKNIEFNSDRTNFVQNELTKSIECFLLELNKKIQEYGSIYKHQIIKFDILKEDYKLPDNEKLDFAFFKDLIKDDIIFKGSIDITLDNNQVVYSLVDKQFRIDIPNPSNIVELEEYKNIRQVNEEPSKPCNKKKTKNKNAQNIQSVNGTINLSPGEITTKIKTKKINIPSKQINLKDYISSAHNSKREAIDLDDIIIKVDGETSTTKIIESITKPCVKTIVYSYRDKDTGEIHSEITLEFVEQHSPIVGKNSINSSILEIPAQESYSIDFNVHISELINEINSLSLEKHKCVIACSLRSLMEVSIDTINKSDKYKDFFNNTKGFNERVLKVVEHISSNGNYKKAIHETAKIDFNSLGNLLNKDSFNSAISNAHLGAHKSTTYLTKKVIEELAKACSVFLVITNEMLSNNDIN